jgi:glucose-6-phosphate-specific signal transduction histidine kinase
MGQIEILVSGPEWLRRRRLGDARQRGKHARASVVEMSAEAADGVLRVRVRDDGIGGADSARGSGLLGLKDRIEALGGTFSVHSPVGRGTTVTCEVPVTAGSGLG